MQMYLLALEVPNCSFKNALTSTSDSEEMTVSDVCVTGTCIGVIVPAFQFGSSAADRNEFFQFL